MRCEDDMRPSTQQSRLALKAASRRLVDLTGGVESAAARTRLEKSRLAQVGSAASPDSFLPIDVLLDLELDTGRPLVTEALARAQGYKLVAVGKSGTLDADGLVMNTMTAMRDLGQWSQTVEKSVEDRILTHGELLELIREAQTNHKHWEDQVNQLIQTAARQMRAKGEKG